MAEDIKIHAIHFLSEYLKYVPSIICNSQLVAIEVVREIFENWQTVEPSPPAYPIVVPPPKTNLTVSKNISKTLPCTHFQG